MSHYFSVMRLGCRQVCLTANALKALAIFVFGKRSGSHTGDKWRLYKWFLRDEEKWEVNSESGR
ncbi:hypothetical protein IAE30_29760 [Pantoea sp. S61]|nr:hypothetical protein [Pantoea sp. S61]